MKKLTSILVALAMILVLAIPAFAATVNTSTEAGVSVKTPATKTIDKAEGTSDPSETYTFKVSNATLGDETYDTSATNLTVEDVLSKYTFTATGKYEFTVTENAPVANAEENITVEGYVATKVTDGEKFKTTETTTYSQAEYKVTALVASDTDAEGNTTYYVQSVQVQKMKNDDGTPATGDKVDLNDEDGKNNFTFVNKYNKKIENKDQEETNETEDATTLKVKKTVSLKEGQTGDIPDQEFKFKAIVTFPANSTETKYTATVKDASGVVADTDKVEFTNGVATVFTLKAGQYLSFDNIETGAKVTSLTEDSYPGFTPSGTIADAEDAKLVTDEGNNAITVNNEYDPSEGTLTGILMSNIPYIVLALVAIGGLCAYVVVRRRNEDNA